MKKVLKVLLIILIIIVLLLGAFVIWQWDNIEALISSVKYTSEDIETLVIENENKMDEVFSELVEDGAFDDLTDEEKEKLISGEMTEEEIEHIKEVLKISKEDKKSNEEKAKGDKIEGTTKEDKKDDTKKDKEDTAKKETSKDTTDTTSSRVNEIISKIYVTRAEFVQRLNALESAALAERKTIKKRSLSVSRVLSFAEKYINQAKALEAECDGKMEGYINELEAELKRLGQSTSMISEIRSTYKEEKRLKKSQLFNKYSKYLK